MQAVIPYSATERVCGVCQAVRKTEKEFTRKDRRRGFRKRLRVTSSEQRLLVVSSRSSFSLE